MHLQALAIEPCYLSPSVGILVVHHPQEVINEARLVTNRATETTADY